MFLILILSLAKAGHIAIWDLTLDYTNAGYATTYTIPFQLTNPLPQSGYLKIVTPYSLHYTQTNNVPNGVTATYSSNLCTPTTALQASVFLSSDSESNTYYIQFSSALQGGVFYNLYLVTSGNNVNIQSAGVQAPLALYTVSSLSILGMVIDRNPSGHTFSLTNPPSTGMIVTTSANSQLMNALTPVIVTVQFKKALTNGRLQIILQGGFTFESCTSCTSTVINFSTGNVVVNQVMNFTVQIRNPQKVTSLYQMTVMSMQQYANTIIELATGGSLQVPQLQLQSHTLSLGWGLQYSSISAAFYPFPIVVYRGDSSSKYNPYNAFNWTFSFSVDLADSVLLQIEVATPLKYISFLLPGSIINNLPGYQGGVVTCVFVNQQNLANGKIMCTNIGQLYKNVYYYIGCRAIFPFDPYNLPLEENFGTLNIYTVTQTLDALIQSSNPVTYIQTTNNPLWTVNNFDATMVSSVAATTAFIGYDPHTQYLGIQPDLVDGDVYIQRLVFNLAVLITDNVTPPVASSPVGNQAITNSGGLQIICNNQLIATNPFLETVSSVTTAWFLYQYRSSQIASYLQFTVAATQTSDLMNMYAYDTNQPAGTQNIFAINGIQIKFHSSIYPDQYLLDFYIGAFDQIKSAYPIYRSSFLYNGYTISTPQPSNIMMGIANYFVSSNSGNSGTYFPTILRIAGYFNQQDIDSAQTTITLFFTNMVPFFKHSDQENTTQVTCSSSKSSQPTCNYYPAGLLGNGQSYMNYERIDVTFDTLPSSSQDAIQLLIPMSNVGGINKFSVFLAAVVNNPLYSVSNKIQIRTIFRLTGGNNIQTNQFAITPIATALSSGYVVSGITSINYQLQQTTPNTVGQNQTSFTLSISHIDSGGQINLNSQTANNANGGGFTLSSGVQFDTVSTTYLSSIMLGTTTSICQSFSYTSSFYQGIANTRYIIFCPLDKSKVNVNTALTLYTANLPYINGNKMPVNTAYTYSDATRGLRTFKLDTQSVIANVGTLKIVQVTQLQLTIPQQQLQFQFTTTNPIAANTIIRVEFSASVLFTLQGSRCSLSTTITHTCVATFTTSPLPIISYAITITYIPAGTYTLSQWGINGPPSGSSLSPSNFNMRTMSQQGNTIDLSKAQGALTYAAAVKQSISLANLQMQFWNRRSRGSFQIDFELYRQIWLQEYLLLDIGGFFYDNQRSKGNMVCYVLEGTVLSTRWSQIDATLSTSVQQLGIFLYPNQDIPAQILFTLRCNGVVMPYSLNPNPMQMSLYLAGQYLLIQTSSAIQLDVLLPNAETSIPTSQMVLVQKTDNAPGSQTDITMNITCSLTNIAYGTSIYVVFPTTYPVTVSNNETYCQINTQFVACSQSDDYTILLQNFAISISSGTQFQLRILGAQQSNQYNSQANEIFIGFGLDNTLIEYGVIYDSIPQDMTKNPPKDIVILQQVSTNNYIRLTSNYTFQVTFPAGAISVAYQIKIVFPSAWDMIINYKLPGCALYDQQNVTNYVSSCVNFGAIVTLTLNGTDYIGSSYYYLQLLNVRNPDYPVCASNHLIIEIVSQTIVIARSNVYNIPTQSFISDPSEIMLYWVDATTLKQITTLTVQTGVMAAKVGMANVNGAFKVSFTAALALSTFVQTSITAGIGYAYTTCQLAGTSSAAQGLQLLEFTKSNDYNDHTPLPFLRVFLQSSQYSLSLESQLYQFTVSGQALPIYFNLSSNTPATNLRIDATLDSQSLYFISKSSITFNPSTQFGAFVIGASDTATVGQSGTIAFTVSGNYANLYGTLPSVAYRIIDINTKRPIISLYSLSNKGTSYLTFNASCTQYATIYYYLSINGSEILQSSDIQTRTLTFPTPDITNYYNQNYGLVNAFNASTNYTIQVSNLRPGTLYNMTAFCVNTETSTSTAQSVVQMTDSNDGVSFYIDFIFQQPINLDFSLQITCFLTLYLKVPARLVRNSINNWCNYQRRLLATTSSTYSESNVRIYVSLIDFYLKDTVTSGLFASGLNKTDLTTQLLNNVAGLPVLSSIVGFTAISTNKPNLNTNSSINYTQTAITIKNIISDQTGFAYAMWDFKNRTQTPTFYDLRVGNAYFLNSTANGSTTTGTTNLTYYYRQRITANSAFNISFSGLTHYTKYSLYYYVSNDDPSEFQQRTYLIQVDFTTLPIYQQYGIMISILIFILY